MRKIFVHVFIVDIQSQRVTHEFDNDQSTLVWSAWAAKVDNRCAKRLRECQHIVVTHKIPNKGERMTFVRFGIRDAVSHFFFTPGIEKCHRVDFDRQ